MITIVPDSITCAKCGLGPILDKDWRKHLKDCQGIDLPESPQMTVSRCSSCAELGRVVTALTELLRLYDWRAEIGLKEARQQVLRADVPYREAMLELETLGKEIPKLLRRYGTEKKAAWEAARVALASIGKATP